MDITEFIAIIKHVTDEYERRRIEDLLSTQTKTGRHTPEQMHGIVGKAQACREIRSLLYTQIGAAP